MKTYAGALAFVAMTAAATPSHAQDEAQPSQPSGEAPSSSAPAPSAATQTSTSTSTSISTSTPVAMPEASAYAAPAAAESPEPRGGEPHRPRFRFGIGARVSYVTDSGFDTFATDNSLGQLALEGSYAFYTSRRLSLAAGLAWDVGSRTSGARGVDTRLTVHHLAVPVEARLHLTNGIYLFGKVAPGLAVFHARVDDPSSNGTLEDTPAVFATDLSAGVSFLIAPHGSFARRGVRFWLTPEGGYGVTASSSLRPRADREEEDVLGSDGRSRLGSLAVSGGFFRIAASATF